MSSPGADEIRDEAGDDDILGYNGAIGLKPGERLITSQVSKP